MMDINDPLLSCAAMSDPTLTKAEASRRYRALQQLRDGFEAAINAIAVDWSVISFNPEQMKEPEFYLADWASDDDEELCNDLDLAAAQLAKRYIIARDFNVYDPITSDMVWKLKNGGAL